MKNNIKTTMNVNNNLVSVLNIKGEDYISLTDLARYKNKNEPGDVIIKWMSNKSSFDFYSLWEELFNEDFKVAEFRDFKLTDKQKEFAYASEADILNVALFGMTAKEWNTKILRIKMLLHRTE